MSKKLDLLKHVSFGNQVAEDESDALSSYFVQTTSWRKILNGDVDVIYGPKGSGKSAIYLLIQEQEGELFDNGVLLISAENPRGEPAFQGIVPAPPTSEVEFVNIWKLYLLSLCGRALHDFGVNSASAKNVIEKLRAADLLPESATSLNSILRTAREYIARHINPSGVESTVHLDATTGTPIGVTGKIIFSEPNNAQVRLGFISIDNLFKQVNVALKDSMLDIWLLLDRLDVAFAESSELEANALRALFRAYRDIGANNKIHLKIFLRTDIWKRITEAGFREATHITKDIHIAWDTQSLLNLTIRRLLSNDMIVKNFDLPKQKILESAQDQEALFYRFFPGQVRIGEKQSTTFDWIIKRTSDGKGEVAPREIIYFLNALTEIQVERLERGEEEPVEDLLFDRAAFDEALNRTSKYKVQRHFFAEYPELRQYLEALKNEKSDQSPESLAQIWKISQLETTRISQKLIDIGFFEVRGTKENPSYWIPFLFRPALELVQGKADL